MVRSPQRKQCVLVVDDNEQNRTLARLMLEQEDYEVTVAASGEETRRRFESAAPDCVLLDVIPERYHHAHIGHRQRFTSAPKLRPMGSGLELFGRRKDDSEFPIEISLSPLQVEGRTLVSSAIRDVTVRRRAEQKFRALLEAAPDAMVIAGPDGRIVLVNAQTERLFGYGRSELLGEPVERLVPTRFQKRHVGHRDGYIKGPKARGMGSGLELFGLRKDGSEFAVEISLSPIETEDGTLISSAIRDITERRQAEAA